MARRQYAKMTIEDAAAVQNIISYTEHPFGRGYITVSSGGQYSPEVTIPSTQGTVDLYMGTVTIDAGCTGAIKQMYFNLLGQLKAATSTTADIEFQWQARNSGGATWANLNSTATRSDPGASYVEDIYQGYMGTSANLYSMPIDLRMRFQVNESTQAIGKISSTSYVTVQFVAD